MKKISKKKPSKQTPKMAKYNDENLLKFIWGNKTEEQLLKEQLKSFERKKPEFKKLLDQAEKKGADRHEIVKTMVKRESLKEHEWYLKIKKALEEDKYKSTRYKKEIKAIETLLKSDIPFERKALQNLLSFLLFDCLKCINQTP